MSGVEFRKVNGVTRSVYRQFDNSFRLADDCICWNGTKKLDCPIDEHAQEARTGKKVTESTDISTAPSAKGTEF
jgi:hypothetical protein